MKQSLSTLIFCCLSFWVFSQGTILLISNTDCKIVINGEIEKELTKNQPTKVSLSLGEHFLQASNEQDETSKIIEITDSKQQIIKLELGQKEVVEKSTEIAPIIISEAEVKLGITSSENINVGLAKADILVIDGIVDNEKGTFNLEVYGYPANNLIYSKKKIRNVNNHRIKIPERGIYIIKFSGNAMFNKKIKLQVERIPASIATKDFNTTVVKKYKFKVIEIGEESFLLNSGIKSRFGGKNELYMPVTIPEDAIEWFYSFTANYKESDLKRNKDDIKLAGKLGKIVATANPAVAAFTVGVELLSKPDGAANCNVYLLDELNLAPFLRDGRISPVKEGTRFNLKSSTVKVKCCKGQQYYIGIENKHNTLPIHVGLEVAAIKRVAYLSMVE